MVRLALLGLAVTACSGKPLDRTTHIAERATGIITIDGKDNEPDWQRARTGPPFVAAQGGAEVYGEARARLLWNDQHLFVFVNVKDHDIVSRFQNHDDPLWQADCVELFIDADGNRQGYVELQVNPNNAHFDAWFPKTRAQPHEFGWNSTFQSAVTVEGTVNRSEDRDTGWNVEIAIPLGDVRGNDSAMKVDIPPRQHSSWRLNAVRIDTNTGDPMRASSWAPIPIQDFHAIDRLLAVTFVRSATSL